MGVRPMELVLLGLGGCTSFDVVDILKKARQPVSDCETRLEAERSADVPSVFTRIHVHFVVTGAGLSEKQVARAVKLSAEKYCSASLMLSAAVWRSATITKSSIRAPERDRRVSSERPRHAGMRHVALFVEDLDAALRST